MFDGLTGDLMKAQLREGVQYCSKEAGAFMESLLEEFKEDFIANRLQVHVLAYNLFNWFRRLALAVNYSLLI